MPSFKYKILTPGGNDTALVIGNTHLDVVQRRAVQETILQKHKNVEQVGFLGNDAHTPLLCMAGGEFCGNAVRAATWHYLDGQPGEIFIDVSGSSKKLHAGIGEDNHVWAQMPVYESLENIMQVDDGLYWVQMEGISHLIVTQKPSHIYLDEVSRLADQNKGEFLLDIARSLLGKYELYGGMACGVMFLENIIDMLKIHPCVFVTTISSAHYETACGSGSIATALAVASIRKKSVTLPLLQPSGVFCKMEM